MIYEVMSKDGEFVDVQENGWIWSEREKSEYTTEETDDLPTSTDDYMIEMAGSGATFMASRANLVLHGEL